MDNFQPTIDQQHSRKGLKKISSSLRLSKYLPFAIVIVVVIVLLTFAVKTMSKTTPTQANNSNQQVVLEKPIATQNLNKSYAFSLKDDKGKEVSKVKYTIEDAELRDDIVIKGQRATAVAGRTFLILNIKIQNNYDQRIQINARDYVRLTVNNDTSDKLAPDIHNDPVDVEPMSTKITRLGFPINTTDKNLTLYVGELTGQKETIKLNLQ